jgi:PTS system nitrogen regulatory IIA component
MSGLDQYLAAERVRIDLKAHDAAGVLEELSRLLGGNDAAQREEVLDSLLGRERVSTTGIGNGVAFPHARVGFLKSTRLAFVRTTVPIDFKGMDGKPVDLFVGVAAPIQSRREHLAILSKLAYLFRSDAVRRKFRNAQSTDEIVAMMAEGGVAP